ncbi:glucosaminidase domain-containing protein [Natronoflexus pectinivorans]|uniref:Peptidoglycan hydrolase n=1 Tax=Natronoflexus pectinivorans TaxID=682526 RepID=A0A4R2GHD3_9BACT|nr:glucosaminidase domain-containing protein [Natronoflexus pectinivorans]TCO07624.1 flagellum-specific peptidoglycan hydrolase FlgJ [Natronoflexus pectinivorans]
MINKYSSQGLLLSAILFFQISEITGQNRITREQYIETYKDWAIEDMRRSGIPASIKLAQGILESASGNSRLAVEANNHFGIKCHTGWEGERVFHHDDARNECFRKYRNPRQSFEDHTTFLTTRPRYSGLFELATTDYKGWANGLQQAGYATNPNYARLLIRIIEENQLYLLDQDISESARRSRRETQRRDTSGELVIDPFGKRQTAYNNGVRYVMVEPGDTFESLSRMFNLRNWEIPSYNDLPANANINKYRILYIENKRRNAHPDHPYHIVKEGETMHEISQQYGVRLNRLYHFNRMQAGEQPKAGDRLNLRRRIRQ